MRIVSIVNFFILLMLPAITMAWEPFELDTKSDPHPYWTRPLSNDDIRVQMILDSNDQHQHKCPCPYSPDAISPVSGQCGNESMYYRPGGFRVYCYMKDISPQEVAFYRIRKGTPYALEHF
jgi:hypothetical protein